MLGVVAATSSDDRSDVFDVSLTDPRVRQE